MGRSHSSSPQLCWGCLTDELATVSTGDVAAIQQAYDQKYEQLQHDSGMAAFRSGLTGSDLNPDEQSLLDYFIVKEKQRFANVEGKGILLHDADGTPAIDKTGKYITPADAAKAALEKFGATTKTSTPVLQPWGRDSQGRVMMPRSQSLDRRAVQANLPIEDFDSGNWLIVDDAKFGRNQPTGTVARQLQQAQSSKALEIKASELPAARDWCRRNSVDPQQFDSMINADKIRVIAG